MDIIEQRLRQLEHQEKIARARQRLAGNEARLAKWKRAQLRAREAERQAKSPESARKFREKGKAATLKIEQQERNAKKNRAALRKLQKGFAK